MLRAALSVAIIWLNLLAPTGGAAQERAAPAPLRGVVWEAPPEPEAARRELAAMRAAGVEAVRTGLVLDERVLAAADALGLRLFQDLPVSYRSAAELRALLPAAEKRLRQALALSAGHPSARDFGLGSFNDTRAPEACAFYERLAGAARAGGARAYYTTAYPGGDRCAGAVDLVLVDARDLPGGAAAAPLVAAAQQAAGGTPVGVGGLGARVVEGAGAGLEAAGSPERQARYLESGLNALLALEAPPAVVFVHQWRDAAASVFLRRAFYDPQQGRYGLHTAEGAPRPALAVVRGIYTGRQDVFAFVGGAGGPTPTPWPLLLTWSVALVLALFYAGSPRLRQMIPRYFLAQGFYRDAVREGRDILLGSSAVLLAALGCALGVLAATLAGALHPEPAYRLVMHWLPEGVREAMHGLLARPWMMIVLLGSIHALFLVFWSTILSIASRRRFPLSPGQALMLVVWPRWPMLLLMAVAVVGSALEGALALQVMLGAAAAWLALTLYAVLRTTYDYGRITRMPLHKLLLVLLAHPAVLAALAAAVLAALHPSEVGFLRALLAA